MSKYKIVKHERWDISEAKYHHWWTLHEYRKSFFRKKYGWFPVKDFYYDSMGGSNDAVVYYSAEKAKAAAKHYGIEVEL